MENIFFPELGYGLPLSKRYNGLVTVDGQGQEASNTHVKEAYQLNGSGDAATLRVTREYTGHMADQFRVVFASYDHSFIEKELLADYEKRFDGIRSVKGFDLSDDLKRNRLTITEEYEMDSFWQKDGSVSEETVWRNRFDSCEGVVVTSRIK